jgi:hypothetical protein
MTLRLCGHDYQIGPEHVGAGLQITGRSYRPLQFTIMFRGTAWKYTHIRGCDVFETSHAQNLTRNAILLLQLVEG